MRRKRSLALKRKARELTKGMIEGVTKVMYRQLKRAYKQRLVDGQGNPK
jgi:hypothetical protein